MAIHDDETSEMERRLALLWGARAPGRRGPRPRLSPERIAGAAIRVADTEGLEALSMQRVAAELGCAPMSLYNHVPNKDALLELMVDTAAGEPPPAADGPHWREGVLTWTDALWRTLRRHPWVLRAPVEHAPLGPRNLAWFDRLVGHLLTAGLAHGEAVSAALHLLSAIRGMAQVTADLTRTDHGTPRDGAETARLLAQVMDPDLFPALDAVVRAGVPLGSVPEGDGPPPDTRFGVERFLDGVEAWVSERPSER
jgi:AcrR family transcriptional regulator